MSDDDLSDGTYMMIQKSRMDHALLNANRIPSEKALALAAAHIEENSGISMSTPRLLEILSLYPMERGKLADYGCHDTEVTDLMMDVIANFIAGTRWPLFRDQVNIDVFVRKLQTAAKAMGFETTKT
jgi:hypothetical protein